MIKTINSLVEDDNDNLDEQKLKFRDLKDK